jgi:hypothetical protein
MNRPARTSPLSLTARLTSVAVLLAGLTACANQTLLSPVHLENYDPQDLFYLANKGPVLTEVVGNPFDESKPLVDNRVTSTMTGANFFPRLTFDTKVPPEQNSPYHVIMVLDAAGNTRPERLCANPRDADRPEASHGPGGAFRIVAVYCVNDRRLSSISGTAPRPDNARDPRFVNLIRQATLNLFPTDNPDRRDENRLRRLQ